MVDKVRKKRIGVQIQRELGVILLKNTGKPFYKQVTITSVDISADLSVAKVFFVVYNDLDVDSINKALQDDSKFFRKMLAHNINLRLTPRLNFIYDRSIVNGQRLSFLVNYAIEADKKNRDSQ